MQEAASEFYFNGNDLNSDLTKNVNSFVHRTKCCDIFGKQESIRSTVVSPLVFMLMPITNR